MLFTWDTTNLCIVFRQWRVTGTASLIWTLLVIVALCAGYEGVREISRRYELYTAREIKGSGSDVRGEFGGGKPLAFLCRFRGVGKVHHDFGKTLVER